MTQQGAANCPWIFRLRRSTPPRLRLFCLPYAGGSASVYRAWPSAFPQHVEVCAVRLPGREARLAEPAFTRCADLVSELAEGLAPLLDLPYALMGHSMGALAAFELARHLRRTRDSLPTRLFVSGARAPERPNPDAPVAHLSDAEFLDEVSRRYDAIPGAVRDSPELVELLLPSLRADFAMFESYVCRSEAPLDCPISAFGGFDDPRVGADDVSAWSGYTRADFSVRMFPGGHFFIHAAEAAVQRAVAEDLALVEVTGGGGQ